MLRHLSQITIRNSGSYSRPFKWFKYLLYHWKYFFQKYPHPNTITAKVVYLFGRISSLQLVNVKISLKMTSSSVFSLRSLHYFALQRPVTIYYSNILKKSVKNPKHIRTCPTTATNVIMWKNYFIFHIVSIYLNKTLSTQYRQSQSQTAIRRIF